MDEERLPFPDNYFDEVYSKNLIEHLRNPGFALREMKRVLKPGREDNNNNRLPHIEFGQLEKHIMDFIPQNLKTIGIIQFTPQNIW